MDIRHIGVDNLGRHHYQITGLPLPPPERGTHESDLALADPHSFIQAFRYHPERDETTTEDSNQYFHCVHWSQGLA